jgi:hypothetical protein
LLQRSRRQIQQRVAELVRAQRDACEAYIASQRAEGWALVRDR